jgi:hypothetical protein
VMKVVLLVVLMAGMLVVMTAVYLVAERVDH